MTYEEAVREKKIKQREQFGKLLPDNITVTSDPEDHKFKQTFYIQESFEPRKLLWFTFNKKVGQEVIPVGLCSVCNKLEIEHNQ